MDTNLHKKKDERLVVPISEGQKEQLSVYAQENGVSMAMAARLILSSFFEGNLLKKQVSSKEINA